MIDDYTSTSHSCKILSVLVPIRVTFTLLVIRATAAISGNGPWTSRVDPVEVLTMDEQLATTAHSFFVHR